MFITRRKFLHISSTAALGVVLADIWLPELLKAASVSNGVGKLPIIWFQAQTCSGCSVSLINTEYPNIEDILIEVVNLVYNPTIMGGTGDVALKVIENMMEKEQGNYILAVEGSIPLAAENEYCTVGESYGVPITATDWIINIAKNAKAVLAIGSCASWGGIPSAPPNPTGAVPISKLVHDIPIINIPGCPPHPDWMTGTLVHVIKYGMPELDDQKRPIIYFGKDKVIHDNCELREYFDRGKFAKDFGDDGCLYELGCKGPVAHCDVSIRGWNSGVNWCNRSGGPCIGCTEPSFPGLAKSGLYERLPSAQVPGFAGINTTANTVGKVLGIATITGICAHAIARSLNIKKAKKRKAELTDKTAITSK